ncbi:BnaC01g22180D [Brassica napus]|uniref:BnaC01g22180D protein n=1 Tax=Brassica napus TaxID=3708 RepID=A0A078I4U2_BRANA|nr:BnaC01g22180D [Brassica napus]
MEILKKVYALYPTRGLKCDGCSLGENYYGDDLQPLSSTTFFEN